MLRLFLSNIASSLANTIFIVIIGLSADIVAAEPYDCKTGAAKVFCLPSPDAQLQLPTSEFFNAKTGSFFQIGGEIRPDSRVVLDFSNEALFLRHCGSEAKSRERCLASAPYVKLNKAGDQLRYFQAQREARETKQDLRESIHKACVEMNCKVFQTTRPFDRLKRKGWRSEWRTTCTQLVVSIADDEQEYQLLREGLTPPNFQFEKIFIWNPKFNVCDDVGFIVVKRGQAKDFVPVREVSK